MICRLKCRMAKTKRKFNNESKTIYNGKRRKFNNKNERITNGFIHKLEEKKIGDLLCILKEFHSDICSEKEVLRKSLRKFLNLLQENQQNSELRSQITTLGDVKFITGLLWRYNCTLSGEDLLIFDILEQLETNYCLDFRICSPLVFGERSKPYYAELIKYGRILHKYLDPDQVLEYFDQKRMWQTLLKMASFDRKKEFDQNCYDPRFVLRSLVQLIKPGTKLNCKNMVTSNALSFCFASTSFHDPFLRTFAYAFLERFRTRLFELSDERFPQRIIYRHLLDIFRDSLEFHNQRINNCISHFLARFAKIILSPEEPIYAPLMAFLSQKPFLQLDSVPEFIKLFFSTSTQFCLKERQWILRLLSNSIIDAADYGALCRIYGLESCLSLFCTTMADYWGKLLMFKIFRSCLELKSALRDMFFRLDFGTWLANTILHKRTTVMEEFELAEIFKILVQKINEIIHQTDLKLEEGNEEMASKSKIANLEQRRPFLEAKLRLNAQKIFDHLGRDERISDEKELKKREELVEWFGQQFGLAS